MKKQQLILTLEKAWTEFKESYLGLSEAQIQQPDVVGEWSIKDIIGHVTTWEEEALKALALILQGEKLPRYKDLYGGLNKFNALMTEKKHVLSLSEILEQSEFTHKKLLAYISNAPEEMFKTETRFRRRIRLDTYSHYPEHTKAILAWRKEHK